MLVETGWSYRDLMETPHSVVVAVTAYLAERNRRRR